ncbi:MAG TPA: porin [Polyangiaceae bacterium]|nr:porin [Polyangiaceae bacterium]
MLALTASLWTLPAAGQGAAPAPAESAPPPAPAPGAKPAADDDLELPAKPASSAAPAPSATPPASASPPSPVAPSAAAGSASAAATAGGNAHAGAGATAATAAPEKDKAAAQGDAKQAVEKKSAWPEGLRVGGYIQAQYETNQQSEDQLQQGGVPLNQNRFLIRRARLRLDRDWEYVRAALEFDGNTTRGVTFGIRRAEASLLYRGDAKGSEPPLVMVTLGIMDIPFGYDLLEATRERPFMERSTGSLALFPTDQDAGVRVSGGISFFRYAVAVMNGEPVDNSGFPRDPNAAKDIIGRLGVDTKTGALSIGGGTSFATGKGFHAGQDAGKNQVVWRDGNQDGNFDAGEIAAVPGSGATPSKNYERWALGLDVEAALETKLGRSKLYAEGFVAQNYDRGVLPADPIVTGVDVREAGAYAALLQDVTKYGLVGFRGGFYDPNLDTTETRQGRLLPLSQTVWTLSPLVGLTLRGVAKLLFQYDFVLDKLGRDSRGVPANAENNQATVRLQVEL